jgi:ribosomal protein eL8
MDFNVPDGIMAEALAVLAKSKEKGKIKIGINEVTKAVEREVAKFVLIAEDVQPKEIVMHIPLICDEKKIPYCPVKTKKELGEKAGIEVGTSSIAILDPGVAKKELADLIKKLAELKGVKE